MLGMYEPEVLLDCVYYLKHLADFNRLRDSHYKCMLASAAVIVDHLVSLRSTNTPLQNRAPASPFSGLGFTAPESIVNIYHMARQDDRFYVFNRAL